MTLTRSELRAALAGRTAALKAVLLDQQRVAGLGNLLVDEVLWRAGLDPTRPAGSLSDDELVESDVILPPRDIAFHEAKDEFNGDGLIPD